MDLLFLPYLLGIVLSAQVIYITHFMSRDGAKTFFVITLAVVVSAFPLFPLFTGDRLGLKLESIILILFLLTLSFCKKTSYLLPIAWFVHGTWDLLHISHITPIDKPFWVSQICVSYDWIIAAHLLFRVRTGPS